MKYRFISILKCYILVSKLLQIITLFELVLIFLLVPILLPISTDSTSFSFALRIFFILFLISLPVFSQLDARSRFQNYKQIKDQLYAYGFDIRIFRPIIKSRCQRDAALLACTQLGYKDSGKSFFKSCGYKWYHIIPDYFFQTPQIIFTIYFWKTTFFTPTYYSKFDYSMLTNESPGLTSSKLTYG
ncbi:MAG: hypothetical protein R2750_06015 [Bacteroidales bacterium]